MESQDVRQVILYDGVCGLCDRFVQFVLRRDRDARFHFAPLQSEYAGQILGRLGYSEAPLSTVFLVVNPGQADEAHYVRGRAAIKVVRQLGFPWSLLGLLGILPTPILDWGYRLVANNRYRLFGKLDACRLPSAGERARFIGL